jgi:hypothetical protein
MLSDGIPGILTHPQYCLSTKKFPKQKQLTGLVVRPPWNGKNESSSPEHLGGGNQSQLYTLIS